MAKETKEVAVEPTVVAEQPIAPIAVAPAAPATREVTEADMERVKLSTKQQLDAMPKVAVRLPKAGKDQPNYETVQINGYTYQIQRGVDVMVPQLVKDILAEGEII